MTATTLDPQVPEDTRPDPPKRRIRRWMIVTAGSLAALILAGGMYGASAMGSKTAAAPKAAPSSFSPLTITQGPPAGVAAPAAAAKPVPVPTVTVTAQAAVPAAAPAAPVAPAPAFTDASAVVDQYYADITARSYWAAWLLGGDNIGGGSYPGWVAGFDTTESITLGTFSDWGASQVQVTLSALQDDGLVNTYVGTYTVAGGVIVAASIVQELRLRQAAKDSACSRSIGWRSLERSTGKELSERQRHGHPDRDGARRRRSQARRKHDPMRNGRGQLVSCRDRSSAHGPSGFLRGVRAMSTYPETETVARILARGYNQHIRLHGPDSSAAGEAIEMADGHGLLVVRDGAEYAVRVTQAQAMTVDECDVLDFIDRTVAQITGAEIDGHLRKVLGQAGYRRELAAPDRWAALRAEIVQERAAQDQIAADQAELGHDRSSERAYGRVEALDQMMAWMDREDGTS
jgi:hypothetical protein